MYVIGVSEGYSEFWVGILKRIEQIRICTCKLDDST
jgi:hypothetical protein